MNRNWKRMMKKGIRIFTAGAMVAALAGCSSAAGSAKNDVPVVTIWSSGGQEVREALQAIADSYNQSPDYSQKAKVEIQFIVSGTSEQSLPDRLAAAYKAGETETDFDLIAIDDSSIAGILA